MEQSKISSEIQYIVKQIIQKYNPLTKSIIKEGRVLYG